MINLDNDINWPVEGVAMMRELEHRTIQYYHLQIAIICLFLSNNWKQNSDLIQKKINSVENGSSEKIKHL